ncbi:hypothetical protein BDR03DRAFT_874794, partial [Suillus americanus]
RLTISGESKRSDNYNKGSYVVQERSRGKFLRTLQIPQAIKVNVHVKMENGVLTACFSKAGPDHQPQRIAIA